MNDHVLYHSLLRLASCNRLLSHLSEMANIRSSGFAPPKCARSYSLEQPHRFRMINTNGVEERTRPAEFQEIFQSQQNSDTD
jgi:hypothetical protein